MMAHEFPEFIHQTNDPHPQQLENRFFVVSEKLQIVC